MSWWNFFMKSKNESESDDNDNLNKNQEDNLNKNQEDNLNKNQEDNVYLEKTVWASCAVAKRLTKPLLKSIPSLASDSSVPSLKAKIVKLQDCPKECDKKPREAKFAFRSIDLESWKDLASASSSASGTNANSDPIRLQHWAVAIHFPEGDLTFVFEAYNVAGKLEGYRARFVDYEVFEKAKYFGTAVTSPRELLDKAKQIKSNGTEYNPIDNNCQIWLKEFLNLVSPNVYQSLKKMIEKLELRDFIGWTVGTYIAVTTVRYYCGFSAFH